MRYYIIAGEPSGDLHGSNLMRGLKESDPGCEIRFWGGDMMVEAGGTLVRHYRETVMMGFVEVLRKLDKVFSNLSFCRKDLLANRPDVLILIDYPGFNMKMAKFAKKNGIKVFYYISPKVWAWKEGRVKLLKKYVDMLYIIFPFEVPYFKKKGVVARYFGNPLIDRIENDTLKNGSREDFIKRHSLEDKTFIALLPGSRKMEIDFLLPRMKGMVRILNERYPGRYHFLLAAAPSTDPARYGECEGISIIRNETYSILRHSAAAVISSGTASLEAALIGTPQVVCYGGSPISVWIARKVIRIDTISLAHMILGRHIFKEWIQEECSPEALSQEVIRLTADTEAISRMKSDYAEMRALMGESGASFRVGQDMYNLLNGTR